MEQAQRQTWLTTCDVKTGKGLPTASFYHFQYTTSFVALHHVVNVKFNLSPLCHHCFTHFCTVDRLEPCIFHYIHAFSLFIMSLRTHLDRYCQQRAMANDRISPTRRSRSPTRAPSSATGSSPFQRPPGWTPPSTTPHRPVILQLDLKPMQQLAARNPYYNILTPKVAGNLSTETYDSLFQTFKVIYPDYARSHFVSDLKTVVTDTLLQRWSIHLQATDFYMMIDTDQGAQMLDDLPHSLLDILNWVLSIMEDSPTPRCLHVTRMYTFVADTPSRSTRYGLCGPYSSDSSRASIRYGNTIYQNCRLTPLTCTYL